MGEPEERIVMTPKKKTANSTCLAMERRAVEAARKTSLHVAGGEHSGIVINKEAEDGTGDTASPAQLCLEFRVFLVNLTSGKHAQEKRVLSFWFKPRLAEAERPRYAQNFFKQLVSPTEFPRDYVGFIKKIMKLMQLSFPELAKVEVELVQEKELDQIPERPTRAGALLFTVGQTAPVSSEPEAAAPAVAVEASVMELLEAAYPNPVTLDSLVSGFPGSSEAEIRSVLSELQLARRIKALEHNLNSFTVAAGEREAVTVVKQMPRVEQAKQPTIAIITSQYFEKVAVDAMMTNRQTYVKYATVGFFCFVFLICLIFGSIHYHFIYLF